MTNVSGTVPRAVEKGQRQNKYEQKKISKSPTHSYTREETFLRRQQRRPLHGIFGDNHGVDADAVECSPEVEVASGPAPTGSRSQSLVSGWIDKLICVLIYGVTLCAPLFLSRRSPGEPLVKAQARGTPDPAARARLVPGFPW